MTLENKFKTKVRYAQDRIYSENFSIKEDKSYHKKSHIGKIALMVTLTGIAAGTALYAMNAKRDFEKEKIKIEKILNNEKEEKEYGRIKIKLDGKIEEFYYTPEKVNPKEIKYGIVIWNGIKKEKYNGKKVSYPVGDFYLFKENFELTRIAVNKFKVAGGHFRKGVNSMFSGVYVFKKFQRWPPYYDPATGEIKLKGGDEWNPWGYGRFYQYPALEQGRTMELLTKENLKISDKPDEYGRYLHGTALRKEGIRGIRDYYRRQKDYREKSETDFVPNSTIGCTRTSNYAMDYLEERIQLKDFRVAYIVHMPDEE